MLMAVCDLTVARNARGRLYDNVDSIPHRKVGLILGTSPVLIWTVKKNYYFINRIKAGAELYNAGKVDWLVVSGGDYRRSEKHLISRRSCRGRAEYLNLLRIGRSIRRRP